MVESLQLPREKKLQVAHLGVHSSVKVRWNTNDTMTGRHPENAVVG